MASVMCFHFSIHEEDILEHIDVKCRLCNISIHLINNIIKHTHVKMLVNKLER